MRLSGHINFYSSIIDTDVLSLCVMMSQVDRTPTALHGHHFPMAWLPFSVIQYHRAAQCHIIIRSIMLEQLFQGTKQRKK